MYIYEQVYSIVLMPNKKRSALILHPDRTNDMVGLSGVPYFRTTHRFLWSLFIKPFKIIFNP